MSRYRRYTIECDGPAAGVAPAAAVPAGEPDTIELCETRTEAEASARRMGWSLGKTGDRCPKCRG